MYEGTKAIYTLCELETDWLKCKKGVWQGCVLSPLLFGLYTEELAVRVKATGLGVKLAENKTLSLLLCWPSAWTHPWLTIAFFTGDHLGTQTYQTYMLYVCLGSNLLKGLLKVIFVECAHVHFHCWLWVGFLFIKMDLSSMASVMHKLQKKCKVLTCKIG